MTDVLAAAAEAAASGGRAALVTIVRATGSTPQRVGAKMLVYEDGRTIGTIGGGCYEHDACLKARGLIESGRPALVHYDLNDDVASESGLVCGGQMDVFIEPIVPPADLYVVGAGHVGYHVARLGALVGFRVHVIDDREKFANRERFPDAAEVEVDAIDEWLARASLPRSAYAVIVTRGHRHDLDALRQLVGRDLRYVGLIGSRAKVARLFETLRREGVSEDGLRRVRAPIGLDIGAVSPEEIAIAIVAEIIAVKYGKLRPEADEGAPAAVRALKWQPAART
jgi:xanthine dehydrogenase accessory factor